MHCRARLRLCLCPPLRVALPLDDKTDIAQATRRCEQRGGHESWKLPQSTLCSCRSYRSCPRCPTQCRSCVYAVEAVQTGDTVKAVDARVLSKLSKLCDVDKAVDAVDKHHQAGEERTSP
jgi:hypothetical protein